MLLPPAPTLASSYIHSLDPVILPITGAIAVRWYGVAYLTGFVVAWLLIRWMARTGRIALRPDGAGDFMMFAIVGVLVGGRLGYCLFYDLFESFEKGATPLLWKFTAAPPFWGALAVHDGGMASHGGIIGVILGIMWFARSRGLSKLHMLDIAAFTCTPGLFFGRIANFINGELWGKALPATMQAASPWWSVKYPAELERFAGDGSLASMTEIARAAGIDATAWQRNASLYGVDSEAGREATRVVRTWIEQVIVQLRQGNEALEAALQPVLTAYYPSQLLQAAAEGLVLFALLAMIWLKPRKPGVVGSWFLLAYGVLRVATEVFRQPDEGVAVILGLQRGQLLSVLMIVSAIIGLLIVSRRPVEKAGGLLRAG